MWTLTPCAVLWAVAVMAADDPPAAQDDQLRRVMTLVRQLDDDSVQRRGEAEAALLAWGPTLLDLLPAHGEIASAETRRRLARIRETLEIQRARQFLAASQVRLEGSMSAAAALRAVEEQTGNRLLGVESFNQPIVADLPGTPFWEALDDILEQAGLTVVPTAERGGGLQVTAGQVHRAQRAAYRDVFRLEPTLVTAVRDLHQPALSTLRVRLSVAWEPRIRPIVITQRFDTVAARDDLGRVLEVGRRGSLSVAVERDTSGVDWEIVLGLPDRQAQRLAALSGTFEALLPGPVEQFEFGDLPRAARVAQRRAAAVVSIQEVHAGGAVLELQVHLTFDDALDALESHRGWVERNAAYLVDPAGRRIEASSQRLISQQPSAVGIAVRFPAETAWADCRFVYETPALLVRVPVTYELRDIVLP
jgi:hypothetical protein